MKPTPTQGDTSPGAVPPPDVARLRELWTEYRQLGTSSCEHCAESAALVAAVRDTPRGYQLLCACCGWATPWFDLRDGEIVLLGLDRFGRRAAGRA